MRACAWMHHRKVTAAAWRRGLGRPLSPQGTQSLTLEPAKRCIGRYQMPNSRLNSSTSAVSVVTNLLHCLQSRVGIALDGGATSSPATSTSRRATPNRGLRAEESARTSRMTRECQVRICEGLGVKFPGPTRPKRRRPRQRVYVSFWGSSGSAWTNGLGRLRRKSARSCSLTRS